MTCARHPRHPHAPSACMREGSNGTHAAASWWRQGGARLHNKRWGGGMRLARLVHMNLCKEWGQAEGPIESWSIRFSGTCTWPSEYRPNGKQCPLCNIALRFALGLSRMRLLSEGGATQLQLGQGTKGGLIARYRLGPLPSRCHVVATLSSGVCGLALSSTSQGRHPYGGSQLISFRNRWPPTTNEQKHSVQR